jgi:hypothetical protein
MLSSVPLFYFIFEKENRLYCTRIAHGTVSPGRGQHCTAPSIINRLRLQYLKGLPTNRFFSHTRSLRVLCVY